MTTILRPPLSVRPGLKIVAHRGASAYAPENTLAAFDLAVKMNVMSFETDTQLTTDGIVVLCHDQTLERYGHGPRRVEDESFETLRRLDMGSWFSPQLYAGERIVALRELFERFESAVTYDVELKGRAPGLVPGVAALIKEFSLIDRCKVTSFSWDLLVAMGKELPGVRRSWIVREVTEEIFERRGLDGVGVKIGQLSESIVARLHEVVADVHAWSFYGSPQEILAYLAAADRYGCDSLTINWPDWAAAQG